jgi:hypothetical protein
MAWVALGVLTGFSDTWLATGSAAMSVVIVVLVAVLENAQRRSDQAIQRKLNAIADALADFMCETHVDDQQVKERPIGRCPLAVEGCRGISRTSLVFSCSLKCA